MSAPTVVTIVCEDDDHLNIHPADSYRDHYIGVAFSSDTHEARGTVYLSRGQAIDLYRGLADAIGSAR